MVSFKDDLRISVFFFLPFICLHSFLAYSLQTKRILWFRFYQEWRNVIMDDAKGHLSLRLWLITLVAGWGLADIRLVFERKLRGADIFESQRFVLLPVTSLCSNIPNLCCKQSYYHPTLVVHAGDCVTTSLLKFLHLSQYLGKNHCRTVSASRQIWNFSNLASVVLWRHSK